MARWTRPAWTGFAAVCAYILANGLITGRAEAQVADLLRRQGQGDALVVASPPPLAFWKRDVFWRTSGRYGSGTYVLGAGGTVEPGVPTGMGDLRLRLWASTNPAARAFLFWARKPVATRSEEHTSELQSLMRISYAVVCLKKQTLTSSKATHMR